MRNSARLALLIAVVVVFVAVFTSSSFSQTSLKLVFFEHVRIFDGHQFSGQTNV